MRLNVTDRKFSLTRGTAVHLVESQDTTSNQIVSACVHTIAGGALILIPHFESSNDDIQEFDRERLQAVITSVVQALSTLSNMCALKGEHGEDARESVYRCRAKFPDIQHIVTERLESVLSLADPSPASQPEHLRQLEGVSKHSLNEVAGPSLIMSFIAMVVLHLHDTIQFDYISDEESGEKYHQQLFMCFQLALAGLSLLRSRESSHDHSSRL